MRKCGILLHPISLPGHYGIGDLGAESYAFVDFLAESGQKIWQVLPLGHTGFGDSPYQSFSTFAGNPLLISPDILVKEELLSEDDIAEIPYFEPCKIEYGKVIDYKYSLFRKAFKNFSKRAKGYSAFCRKNAFWLDDYALFLALKNYFIEKRKNEFEPKELKAYRRGLKKYLTADTINDNYYGASWNSFPEELRDRDPAALEKYTKLLKDEIDFYKFLQFTFFKQWTDLKKYANESGIEIIGDIPIFVAADSADTWSRRDIFHINAKGFPTEVAGVPPDYFSEDGQLWGNPLYDWTALEAENYDWWVKRIEKMTELADIVRIDHFRAFESYWSIPFGSKTAKTGKWKKGPQTALFEAVKEKLGDVKIIAEDLGDLNPEVLELRDKLGLPGMKILQFAFGSPDNPYFPHNYPNSNCVVYTGTHDNDTTLGWYMSCDERTRDMVRRVLNVNGDNIVWDMIRWAISSSADYCIIPVQDILGYGEDARMNTPGVSGGNWQFRFEKGRLTPETAKTLNYLCKLFNR